MSLISAHTRIVFISKLPYPIDREKVFVQYRNYVLEEGIL